jgi:hypothetical protein
MARSSASCVTDALLGVIVNRLAVLSLTLMSWLSLAVAARAQDPGLAQETASTAWHPSAELAGEMSGEHHDADHHAAEHDWDHFAPFHHRHETRDGFPILELLKTDHAFLERKVRLDFVSTRGCDNGTADETEFNTEFFWALNNRIAVVVESPLIFRRPDDAPRATGVGDTEFGLRFVAFNGETSILTFGLNVSTPTGNDRVGLGAGYTVLEPVALWWYDLGHGNALQSELAIETPLGGSETQSEFRYNVGVSHTIRATEGLRFFHWLTPLVEVNGLTTLNGDACGQTTVDLTPGLRWTVSDGIHAAVGWSFPITGTRDYDSQLIATSCIHF